MTVTHWIVYGVGVFAGLAIGRMDPGIFGIIVIGAVAGLLLTFITRKKT